MIIKMFKELSDNYKELSGNYNSVKKKIETINKKQEEMKNSISEIFKKIHQKEIKAGWVKQRTESASRKTKKKEIPRQSNKMKKTGKV